MLVCVLLFAGLREAVGQKQLFLELPEDSSVGELMAQLGAEHGAISAYRGRLVISVNAERAPLDQVLREGDEVALLPPVSGGSGRRWVTEAPLSMDALIAEVMGPEMGGLVTFTGIVREHSKGQAIDHLEYEAYGEMAERELRKIGKQVEERWPMVRYAVAHRIGRLAIGDPAVMIAAAAPHRPPAFEACRYIIDTLKQTVPIWKKEFATSGAYWVEENP